MLAQDSTGTRDLSNNALDQNATKEGSQPKKWIFTTGSR
jgi:hypothetical protein